jgi:outer membrane receptor protein involved in Fe transport
MIKFYFFIILCFLCYSINAQNLTLKGRVFNSEKEPVAFATVSALNADSIIQKSTVSDSEGNFSIADLNIIRPILKFSYLGYRTKLITPVFDKSKGVLLIDPVYLVADASLLKQVTISAKKENSSIQLEKKVIDARQFQNAAGGTGLDLLKRIASVTVTTEGEITLRGNAGFQVLINGKPSNRAPADVLAQLPAGSIENVEVITTPSAKYDSQGNAGIINIVLKKNAGLGWSVAGNGMFAGYDPVRYAADLSINYITGKLNAYASGDYRRFDYNGYRASSVRTIVADTLTYAPSGGIRDFDDHQHSIRAGASYAPDANNSFNLNLYEGKKESARTANLNYGEYYKVGSFNSITDDNLGVSKRTFYNHNLFVRAGKFNTASLDYTHTFTDKSKLTLLGLYEYSVLGGPLTNVNAITAIDEPYSVEHSQESSPLKATRLQVDYTLATFGKTRLSTGYQLRLLNQKGTFTYKRTDAYGNTYWDPAFNDRTDIRQSINAGYLQMDGASKKFSYSIGLRTEYSQRTLANKLQAKTYEYNKLNLFPSIQGLWSLDDRKKLRLGYNRRIDWPNPRALSPFKNHRHEETIEIGDPSLLPEIRDIVEVTFNNNVSDRFNFSITPYFNYVQNKLFRVNDSYSRITLLRIFTNGGNAASEGIEVTTELKAASWWRFLLDVNAYYFQLNGQLYTVSTNKTRSYAKCDRKHNC